ncbi:MAG: pilus assembly protein PilM [Candidatus Zixiibacteriota bacterium]
MAAASHVGPKVELLDTSKHYLSGPGTEVTENRNQSIRSEIGRYYREFGGRHSTVVVTLTGAATALRLVTLPELKRVDLRAALDFESRRQIPFPSEDCWIDSRIIERVTLGSDRQVRAAVLAATKVAVEDQLAPFHELGIRVDYVYHTQDVLGTLLCKLSDFDPHRNYMLLDVHRRATNISYYQGSELQFFHVSSLGSSFLANRTDSTIFEYFAESLATELQNSLDYYGGQFTGQSTHAVFIYGDLAYTTELIDLLTDRVGFTFHRFPTERLQISRDRDAPFESDLPVCLPAVAAAVNQSKSADLLPVPLKQARRQRTVSKVGVAVLTLALLLALGQWLIMSTHINTSRKSLDELNRQITAFRSSELFATYSRVKTRLAANQTYLAKTKEGRSYLGLNLKELSLAVPDSVRLINLDYAPESPERNCTLTGLVVTRQTPPEIILAELVENLSRSPFYSDVRVERHVKRRQNDQYVLDFNLTLRAVL